MAQQQVATNSKEELDNQLAEKGVLDKTENIAYARFIAGTQYADALMKNMSAREIRRAVMFALDYGVTDSGVKMINKRKEPELAGVIANLIDVGMIIKANKLKKKEEKLNGKTNGSENEESVVAGTRDTTQE